MIDRGVTEKSNKMYPGVSVAAPNLSERLNVTTPPVVNPDATEIRAYAGAMNTTYLAR